jgi:hypothetical protein
MNELLTKIVLPKNARVTVNVSEEKLILDFEGDIVTLSSYHEDSCCERVYADFEAIKYYIPQLNNNYKKVEIKAVSELGFLICFIGAYEGNTEKVLIPCYNINNGCYSDNLKLIINVNGAEEQIDITQCNQNKE